MFSKSIFLALLSTALGGINSIVVKELLAENSFEKLALYESFFLMSFFGILGGYSTRDISAKTKLLLFFGSLLGSLAFVSYYLSLFFLLPLEFSFLSRNQATISFFLGIIFLKESHSLKHLIAILFLILGSFSFTFSPIKAHNLYGFLFTFLFCLFLSIRGLCIKLGETIPSNILQFWSASFSFLFLAIYFLFSSYENNVYEELSDVYTFCIISISAFISNAIGTTLYFQALRIGSLSSVNSIRATSPIFVAFYSSFLFDYTWTSLKMIGLILCITSMAIFFLPEKRENISNL